MDSHGLSYIHRAVKPQTLCEGPTGELDGKDVQQKEDETFVLQQSEGRNHGTDSAHPRSRQDPELGLGRESS